MLVLVLPAVAGAVNATGFLVVGVYTSHVTGSVARIGDELASHTYDGAIEAAWLVGAFFIGALTAAAFVERAPLTARARYVGPLILEALTLALFAWLSWGGRIEVQERLTLLRSLLCFAMGIQNALVTRLSKATVRTTHLTGVVTDIGIELVRVFLWMSQRRRDFRLATAPGYVARMALAPELRKLRLHVSILASFVLGAIGGPALYLRDKHLGILVPCLVLLSLALFDRLLGLGISTVGALGQTEPAGPHIVRSSQQER